MRKISDLSGALNLIWSYAQSNPDLPAPAITIRTDAIGPSILILTDTLSAFDQWREVLEIDESRVGLHSSGNDHWIAAEDMFADTLVRLLAHGVHITPTEAY